MSWLTVSTIRPGILDVVVGAGRTILVATGNRHFETTSARLLSTWAPKDVTPRDSSPISTIVDVSPVWLKVWCTMQVSLTTIFGWQPMSLTTWSLGRRNRIRDSANNRT